MRASSSVSLDLTWLELHIWLVGKIKIQTRVAIVKKHLLTLIQPQFRLMTYQLSLQKKKSFVNNKELWAFADVVAQKKPSHKKNVECVIFVWDISSLQSPYVRVSWVVFVDGMMNHRKGIIKRWLAAHFYDSFSTTEKSSSPTRLSLSFWFFQHSFLFAYISRASWQESLCGELHQPEELLISCSRLTLETWIFHEGRETSWKKGHKNWWKTTQSAATFLIYAFSMPLSLFT